MIRPSQSSAQWLERAETLATPITTRDSWFETALAGPTGARPLE